MKNILENEKVFEAYATIDCCYYLLQEAQNKLSKSKSPVEIMIDKATGYDKLEIEQMKKDVIDLLNQIIEAKKIIEVDYDNERKILKLFNYARSSI